MVTYEYEHADLARYGMVDLLGPTLVECHYSDCFAYGDRTVDSEPATVASYATAPTKPFERHDASRVGDPPASSGSYHIF